MENVRQGTGWMVRQGGNSTVKWSMAKWHLQEQEASPERRLKQKMKQIDEQGRAKLPTDRKKKEAAKETGGEKKTVSESAGKSPCTTARGEMKMEGEERLSRFVMD